MLHEWIPEEEFFAELTKLDAAISVQVAAAGCPDCGGPLHRGYYERKPRGGLMAKAGEDFRVRHSLCCGRRGCRRRVLPPSFRFLGRRFYLELVVILASVFAQLAASLRRASEVTGVPKRTLRRWGTWWTEEFPALPLWQELRAGFPAPPPDDGRLPESLMARLDAFAEPVTEAEGRNARIMKHAAMLLAPLTARSVRDAPRFVRGLGATAPPTGCTQRMVSS